MEEGRKRGRPPRDENGASAEYVQSRCTHAEKVLWSRAAQERHITVGEAVRFALTAWARDVLLLSESEVEAALHAVNDTALEERLGANSRLPQNGSPRARCTPGAKQSAGDGASLATERSVMRNLHTASADDASGISRRC